MTEPDICGKCSRLQSCKKVYQRLADYRGPSVLGKVFIALVAPLLIFVLSLAVFSSLTTGWTESKELATVLNLLLSGGLTGIYITVAALVFRRFGKNRQRNAGIDEHNKA